MGSCAGCNREGWSGKELCVTSTFVDSQVPDTCNATVNGELFSACLLCNDGNGIELDCSDLLLGMISACPTPFVSVM